MSAFLIDIALKSLIITAASSILIPLFFHRASAATRHFTWFLTTLSLLILPIATYFLPALPIIPSTNTLPQTRLAASITPSTGPISRPNSTLAPISQTSPSSSTSLPIQPLDASTSTSLQTASQRNLKSISTFSSHTFLAIPTFILLALIPIAHLRLRRLKSKSSLTTHEPLLNLLDEQQQSLDITSHINLYQSTSTTMPQTFGSPPLSSPNILLPANASSWPAHRTRSVLLHELAHIKRHDCLTQLIAHFACCLYYFNPLVWFAAHRMHIERERACDDLVLTITQNQTNPVKPSDYAQLILDIATNSTTPSALSFLTSGGGGGGIQMANKNTFEKRILAILDPKRIRTTLTKPKILLITLLLLSLTIPTAMLAAIQSDDSNSTIEVTISTQPESDDDHQSVYIMAPQFKNLRPGAYNLSSDGTKLTLAQLITSAGGLTDASQLKGKPLDTYYQSLTATITHYDDQGNVISTSTHNLHHIFVKRLDVVLLPNDFITIGYTKDIENNAHMPMGSHSTPGRTPARIIPSHRSEKPYKTPTDVEDVADIIASKITLDRNRKQSYILMDHADTSDQTKAAPRPLLLILPGGDGSEDFHFFCRRLYKFAALKADPAFIAAQPIAPVWNPQQAKKVVWPNRYHKIQGVRIPTEIIIENIINDIASNHNIDRSRVIALGWSSAGPAVYDLTLQPNSPITGSFAAMSVFKPTPQQLHYAKNKPIFIYHGSKDTLIDIDLALEAESQLKSKGANVQLKTYNGPHGWFHPGLYSNTANGLKWLFEQSPNMTAAPGFTGNPIKPTRPAVNTPEITGKWYSRLFTQEQYAELAGFTFNNKLTPVADPFYLQFTLNDDLTTHITFQDPTNQIPESFFLIGSWEKLNNSKFKLTSSDDVTETMTIIDDKLVTETSPAFTFTRNKPQTQTASTSAPSYLGEWYALELPTKMQSGIRNHVPEAKNFPALGYRTTLNPDKTASVHLINANTQQNIALLYQCTWAVDKNTTYLYDATRNDIGNFNNNTLNLYVEEVYLHRLDHPTNQSLHKQSQTAPYLGDWYALEITPQQISQIQSYYGIKTTTDGIGYHCTINPDKTASLYAYNPLTQQEIKLLEQCTWHNNKDDSFALINSQKDEIGILQNNSIYLYDAETYLYRADHPTNKTYISQATPINNILGHWYATELPLEYQADMKSYFTELKDYKSFGLHAVVSEDRTAKCYFYNTETNQNIGLFNAYTWQRHNLNTFEINSPDSTEYISCNNDTLFMSEQGLIFHRTTEKPQ
ncbi:Regulatory protein BlaR1 [Poriferisphaera corsica]|uniref:Regulatory protein BlaR1 n=1 Tax=Poriferisphaera corsica TaxID=2528020 RepID=A0A517YR03_9BACT|nr:M56 family metallopeptidase [Poriferisphaera corsica]QDU32643.1 Regulatory protein BlaR1 [Poriferisphaera corsica]